MTDPSVRENALPANAPRNTRAESEKKAATHQARQDLSIGSAGLSDVS
jgi:hypothetical protein